MLTKNDLVQIKTVVSDVVGDTVEKVVERVLENKLQKKLEPIKKDIKIINKRLNKIQKDLTITINYFDKNSIDHEKRIMKIENHLGFLQ